MGHTYEQKLREAGDLDAPRIRLRGFTMEDAAAVLAFGSDPQTLEHLIWEGVSSLQEAERTITDYYQSRPGIYAIEEKAGGNCIGALSLNLAPEHEKASFGYMLHRAYWGRGYMSEALLAVLRLCFEVLLLNRVESEHHAGNGASGRVMEKCGMRCEGVAEQEVKVKGRFVDVVHYGVTRRRWLECAL